MAKSCSAIGTDTIARVTNQAIKGPLIASSFALLTPRNDEWSMLSAMRSIIQRVRRASVTVGSEVVGQIEAGLCVLLGVTHDDGQAQIEKMARKIAELKILRGADGSDEGERLGACEVGAPILLVSQFTLYADVRKGRKPGWSKAAPGDIAEPIVEAVARELREKYGLHVETGSFGAMMDVELVNDGPFTLFVEV